MTGKKPETKFLEKEGIAKINEIRNLKAHVTKVNKRIKELEKDVLEGMIFMGVERLHNSKIVRNRRITADAQSIHERWPDIITEVVPESLKFLTLSKIDKILEEQDDDSRTAILVDLDIQLGKPYLKV